MPECNAGEVPEDDAGEPMPDPWDETEEEGGDGELDPGSEPDQSA